MSKFLNNDQGSHFGYGVTEAIREGKIRQFNQAPTDTPVSHHSLMQLPSVAMLHGIATQHDNLTKNFSLDIRESGRLGNRKTCPSIDKIRTHNSPVSMISGEVLLPQIDFILPGPIPLIWSRCYRSSHDQDFGLGAGWSAPYLVRLFVKEDKVIFADGEGRQIPFSRPSKGEGCRNIVEQLTLYCLDTPPESDGEFFIVDKNALQWHFLGTGEVKRLYAISHPQGYYLQCFYHESDPLTYICDNAGRRLKLEYSITHRLRAVYMLDNNDKPLGKPLVQYHYNNEGDLVSVVDSSGNAQYFHYDHHIISRHTNKDGFNRYFQWDGEDFYAKCLHFWGDGGIQDRRITFDEEHRITASTNSCDQTTVFHYNKLGLITKEIDAQGGISEFEYTSDGLLLQETDPLGNTRQYGYDDEGKLKRFVNPLGHTTRFSYDDSARLICVVDALGMRWQRCYDASGRLTAVIDPLGYALNYQYDEHCNPAIITNAMKQSQRLEWNEKKHLLANTDAAGNRQEFRYDSFGRVVEAQERNQLRRYSYDAMGRIIYTSDCKGETVRLEYTPEGNLSRYIDTLNRVTQYNYHGLPQLRSRTDPNGETFQYGYDKERNLTAMMNENGERCEFHYDQNCRLSKEIGFDGRVQYYGYNAAGHLVSHTDGTKRTTQFKRDALGRLLKKWSSDEDISRYEYDPLGRLVRAVNKDSELEYRYSDNGQLVEERQNSVRLHHEYDLVNLRTATIFSKSERIDYEYNGQGLLKRAAYNNSPLTGITRNAQGREIVRSSGGANTFFAYDSMGRLIQQRITKNQTPIMERNYDYDAAGNLKQIDDLQSGKTIFIYDDLDRLQCVEGNTPEHFNYDSSDNLLDARQAFAGGRVKGNRIKVYQGYRFEYDDAGNLVYETHGKKQTRYFYNTQNQLIKVKKNGRTVEYFYDPLGRRVKKIGAFGEISYLWDGATLLGEKRDDLRITYIHEPGASVPLYQIRDGEVFFYHNDFLGTPLLITDFNGDIVWKARYKVHGSIISYDCQVIDNPIGFHGLYYDSETGLYYDGNRYYHPVIGRFIHQDPLGLATDNNRYEYCANPFEPKKWRAFHNTSKLRSPVPPLATTAGLLGLPLPPASQHNVVDPDDNIANSLINTLWPEHYPLQYPAI